MTHPENQVCFDCNGPKAHYVVADYGIFVCEACSESHAMISTTKGKSILTEEHVWTEDEMLALQLGGNARAKLYFERAFLPTKAVGRGAIKQKYVGQAAEEYKTKLQYDCRLAFKRYEDKCKGKNERGKRKKKRKRRVKVV